MTGSVWRKARRSGGNGGCVEVDVTSRGRVRDSKDPSGPVLVVPGFPALLDGLKGGRFSKLDRN